MTSKIVITTFQCSICSRTIDIEYEVHSNQDKNKLLEEAERESMNSELFLKFKQLHSSHLYRPKYNKLDFEPIG